MKTTWIVGVLSLLLTYTCAETLPPDNCGSGSCSKTSTPTSKPTAGPTPLPTGSPSTAGPTPLPTGSPNSISPTNSPTKPPTPCSECDGKLTVLRVRYNGPDTTVTGTGKKDAWSMPATEVKSGQELELLPIAGQQTLGTMIYLETSEENTELHVSCSVPIGPGVEFGPFTVIEGASLKGGRLCPGPPCSECDGKLSVLVVKYEGKVATTVTGTGKNGDWSLPATTVNPGDMLTLKPISGQSTLGTMIYLTPEGEAQTELHVSCSVPIGPGVQFGPFTVVNGSSLKGGKLCPDCPAGSTKDCSEDEDDSSCECDGKITTLTVRYSGDKTTLTGVGKKGSTSEFSFPATKVSSGDVVTFSHQPGATSLGTSVYITSSVTGDETFFHTSCSIEINVGDVIGPFTILAGASRNNGALCGTTGTTDSILVEALGDYPDYSGSVKITGSAFLTFFEGSASILYHLTGVEAACATPDAGVGNSCGIHIHEGTSCNDATSPGGHFYNATLPGPDPWTTVSYRAGVDRADGTVTANFGYGFDEAKGRALVIHDSTGARVTCALLESFRIGEKKDGKGKGGKDGKGKGKGGKGKDKNCKCVCDGGDVVQPGEVCYGVANFQQAYGEGIEASAAPATRISFLGIFGLAVLARLF